VFDGAAVSAIVKVKQCLQKSVIEWVTKNLLFRALPCFIRHVKPLVPAANAPTVFSGRGGARQAVGCKISDWNFNITWSKTCCIDPT
jgi:hypothetical protein